MAEGETELEMVQRHVREGAVRVERQRTLLARLSAEGLFTEAAAKLLADFEDVQELHMRHWERLLQGKGF